VDPLHAPGPDPIPDAVPAQPESDQLVVARSPVLSRSKIRDQPLALRMACRPRPDLFPTSR